MFSFQRSTGADLWIKMAIWSKGFNDWIGSIDVGFIWSKDKKAFMFLALVVTNETPPTFPTCADAKVELIKAAKDHLRQIGLAVV